MTGLFLFMLVIALAAAIGFTVLTWKTWPDIVQLSDRHE